MNKVLIMMSTYNGGVNINRQVESILCQRDVDISLLIRDDGSEKETVNILEEIGNRYNNVTVLYGNNLGWKESFLELVYTAALNYDYYGFSDQDDIWLDDKIISLINAMEVDNECKPKMAHCNSLSVDEKLMPRNEQENRTPCPPGWKQAIATEYFQGCGMLWNIEAMNLVRRYRPTDYNLAHDYWVGLLCYLLGDVYFCPERKFYHIRYSSNSSEDGNVNKGRLKRIKVFLSREHAYMNPALDLSMGYTDMLTAEMCDFLKHINNYKTNIASRFVVLMDKSFCRTSFASTFLLKMSILMGRY